MIKRVSKCFKRVFKESQFIDQYERSPGSNVRASYL
jgi:hypothetical protein